MNEEGQARYDEGMRSYLRGRVSRAQALKATGLGLVAAAAVPGIASAAAMPTALHSRRRAELPVLPAGHDRYLRT